MHVKCDRPSCLHEWEYDGQSKHGATCPMCRKFVKFPVASSKRVGVKA